SDFAVSNSDYKIKIPTVGFTESLNVATAAGIICEQIKTRLTRSKINWQLSEHDKFDLKIQWARHSVYWWEHIEEQHFLK
ncbi:MAG: TrmH family RNA methyltransferase, partial [Bacteroidota bacterium]